MSVILPVYCSHLTETCSYIDPRLLLPAKAAFSSKHFLRSFVLLKHRLDEVDAYVCITHLYVFVVHLNGCVYFCCGVPVQYLHMWMYTCVSHSCMYLCCVCMCMCTSVMVHLCIHVLLLWCTYVCVYMKFCCSGY